MNREIKFRVWNAREKRLWYIGSTNSFQYYTATLDFNKGWTAWRSNQVIASSQSTDDRLMQFTGLKDKNGKEIYEGDIVTYTAKNNPKESYTNKVYFDNEGYWSPLVSLSYEDGNMQKEFYFEVIGNIYENPRLLK